MFYGEFSNASDVFNEFNVSAEEQVGIHFLIAGYSIDGYEGEAMAIFIQNGKFWLVTGSHCSCYGLEDQWDPEEVDIEVIKHYGNKSNGGVFQGLNEQLLTIVKRVESMYEAGKTAEDIELYLTLALPR